MQFEMAHSSCPLCKREMPEDSPEHTQDTRLCRECQAMVLSAFGRPDSIAAAARAVAPQNGTSEYGQNDATALNHLMVASPALFEASPAYVPAFENQSQSSIGFDSSPFDMSDAGTLDFYKEEDPVHGIPEEDEDSHTFSEYGTFPHREESSEGFVQTGIAIGDDSATEVDESQLPGQAFQSSESAENSAQSGPCVFEDRSVDAVVIADEGATDPWESPLPPWDYSHNEWPVLLEPADRRSFKTVRYGIATVVVLACAAAVYFLMYRPATSTPRTATESVTSVRVAGVGPDAAGLPDSSAFAQAPPVRSDTPAGTAQPAERVALETVTSDDNDAKGRFSLQAAAFPTAGGAGELAERLKGAGLPSYVVPADIARRGRWFRVRIGRFNSAEDAQRFAGEAQQRARATGLTVQLIVCQYDKP